MDVDADGRPLDLLGRVVPHAPNLVGLAAAVPGLLEKFSGRVPGPRIHAEPDGGIKVSCHCGEQHVLRRPMGLTRGDCGRWFLETARQVRVWREPE